MQTVQFSKIIYEYTMYTEITIHVKMEYHLWQAIVQELSC